MDEEFIFQVTEEELAQFPEEENNPTQEEQILQESKQPPKTRKETPQEPIGKQDKENSKVNIPSLLDLKLPKLYAASRNGRWNKGTSAQKRRRECRRRRCQPSPKPRSSPKK